MSCSEICVVMATYNGSKYITEQLDSIRLQTLQPNTVCIIDDCSQDNTVEIIQKYISDYNLSSWQLSIHKENKGYISTFWDAIFATNEKYIFLCDQDDIWYSDKIEKMYTKISMHPECFLLCSDFEPLYEVGGANGVKLFPIHKSKEIDGLVKIDLSESRRMRWTFRPGCTYCVSRSLTKYYPNYFIKNEGHDTFFMALAWLLNGLFLFPESTIKWRQHPSNAEHRRAISKEAILRSKIVRACSAHRNWLFYENEVLEKRFLYKLILYRIWKGAKYKAAFYENPSIFHWLKCLSYATSLSDLGNVFSSFRWFFTKLRG